MLLFWDRTGYITLVLKIIYFRFYGSKCNSHLFFLDIWLQTFLLWQMFTSWNPTCAFQSCYHYKRIKNTMWKHLVFLSFPYNPTNKDFASWKGIVCNLKNSAINNQSFWTSVFIHVDVCVCFCICYRHI